MLSQFCQWVTDPQGGGGACAELATRAVTVVTTCCDAIADVVPSCDDHPRAWMLTVRWCNTCGSKRAIKLLDLHDLAAVEAWLEADPPLPF